MIQSSGVHATDLILVVTNRSYTRSTAPRGSVALRPPTSWSRLPQISADVQHPLNVSQHQSSTTARNSLFRLRRRAQQCCDCIPAHLCTDDDGVRRLWRSCRGIPGARRLETPSLESRQSFLPLQNPTTRWKGLQRAQERRLELQALVHAGQCAGAVVVGGSVLG
jgi:hypothetical protein